MSECLNPPIPRQRGFTLIESIIVIVVIAIAAVGVISLNANIFTGQESNRQLQVGTALMQECAEKIIATYRHGTGGYLHSDLANTTAATASCSGMSIGTVGSPDYVAPPVVTIELGNSSTFDTSCPFDNSTDPDANDCKRVSIGQSGITPIVLLLIKG